MDIKVISQRAIEIKNKYSKLETARCGKEWNNEQIMQGFVGDVGDLMKLMMAKEGLRDVDGVDKKLAHELADCLYGILVLADRYGVDIEKAFLENMDELEKRIK